MQKTWIYKPLPDESIVEGLSKKINVNFLLATLLVQRGITSFDVSRKFFRPDLSQLHDPYLMKDMDQAVKRLNEAIIAKEKILVYGDYDVDGITSVTLVYSFLKEFYNNIEFYIPDRQQEGYGVSERGLKYAKEEGFSLVITLDCGIKAINIVNKANEYNIDFIICDHHNPGRNLPKAVAVLDPKRKDCDYPFKELSGCGVGFKLLEAFCSFNEIPKENIYQKLDLLSLSIACDIVPIIGENRVFTKIGLDVMNSNPKPGIAALIKSTGCKNRLTVANLVFGLGPRINATSRISHANQAVKLFISSNKKEADKHAININKKNELRKVYDSNITEEALALIKSEGLEDRKTIVLFNKHWHKGVVGIVASRCIEHYYRPTIILTESNGKATGSARSIHGFDVYQAITECNDLLLQFGGHKYAAGLTLTIENIAAFQERFEKVVSNTITVEQLTPKINIDLYIDLDRINFKFYNIIKQMAPFGPENMQPIFASENLSNVGSAKILKEKHLKLAVRQKNGNITLDAIGFGMAEHYNNIILGTSFKLCFSIEENSFRGQTTLQLIIRDIKFED